jgi:hypothetical protein
MYGLIGAPWYACACRLSVFRDSRDVSVQLAVATIRSITRLVQVSVVVTDKKGQPITGLKKKISR